MNPLKLDINFSRDFQESDGERFDGACAMSKKYAPELVGMVFKRVKPGKSETYNEEFEVVSYDPIKDWFNFSMYGVNRLDLLLDYIPRDMNVASTSKAFYFLVQTKYYQLIGNPLYIPAMYPRYRDANFLSRYLKTTDFEKFFKDFQTGFSEQRSEFIFGYPVECETQDEVNFMGLLTKVIEDCGYPAWKSFRNAGIEKYLSETSIDRLTRIMNLHYASEIFEE